MKTKIIFLLLALFAGVVLFSCSEDDDNVDEETGQETPNNNDDDNDGETVTDVDGNVYHTVTIGTQTWMVENLKATRYNDGTAIPNVTGISEWASQTTGAYCIYNNDESYISDNDFGLLYNWYAASSGKLAPEGWHVPSYDEWKLLINYIEADNEIKYPSSYTETDLMDESWITNIGANSTGANSTGFSALPAGCRGGSFSGINSGAYWWSATKNSSSPSSSSSYCYYIYGSRSSKLTYDIFYVGYSIRCIKDTE